MVNRRSLGNCICPICKEKGRLKMDLRNPTTKYYINHHRSTTKRYPYYGKYLRMCYLGNSRQFDLAVIERC